MRKKYCDKHFLCYNVDMSINFLSICPIIVHVWGNDFEMMNLI